MAERRLYKIAHLRANPLVASALEVHPIGKENLLWKSELFCGGGYRRGRVTRAAA
jgi:hypothetical protein